MTHAFAASARVHRALAGGRRAPDLATAALLTLAFFVLRWPFRSEYLVNWDAVQFALGTESFSLEHHQPHPPGYIGYVASGWFLNIFTGDANTSLVLISVVSGALAPALLYLLAVDMLGRRAPALIGAVLLGTSPLAWYYSEVALTYMPEATLALGFAYAAYRARTRHSLAALVVATLLLTVLGSFRQTGMALLVPMFLWALWPFAWRPRIAVVALGTVATLAWLVPLLLLAEGPAAYARESAALGELAGGPTSVLSGTPLGIGRNVVIVATGVVAGLNAAIALPFLGTRRGRPPSHPAARHLLWLWTLPALAVYLLGHTGQAGYMLVLLPAGILGLLLIAGDLVTALPRLSRPRQARATGAVVALVLLNAATFLWGPRALLQFGDADATDAISLPGSQAISPGAETAFERQFRQFAIGESDAYWDGMLAALREHPADRSVVLTSIGGPREAGSFRHLTYYLRDFRVFGVAPDLQGRFGHVVSSFGGASDYSVHQLEQSQGVLQLAPGVDRLLVPDPALAALLDRNLLVQYVEVDGGGQLAIAWVPRASTLVFSLDEGVPSITYISNAVATADR